MVSNKGETGVNIGEQTKLTEKKEKSIPFDKCYFFSLNIR